eukprot:2941875-Amphidinium_carterae.2
MLFVNMLWQHCISRVPMDLDSSVQQGSCRHLNIAMPSRLTKSCGSRNDDRQYHWKRVGTIKIEV